MSVAASDLGRLWGPPGHAEAGTRGLLTRAAAAHAALLREAADRGGCDLSRELGPLVGFLAGAESRAVKQRVLCHPLFIEGLHCLAPLVPALRCWHETVTAAPICEPEREETVIASLGHVTLAARLRGDVGWCGQQVCCTDVIGQIGFPLSDWTVKLADNRREFLARRRVVLDLDDRQASWYLYDDSSRPFLVLSRDDFLKMIVENGVLSPGAALFPHPRVRPCLQRATPLGHSHLRYDPTAFRDYAAHAGLTGGLVLRLVLAIRKHSPLVYREFCRLMHSIRGFEFPIAARGTVGSFSDPTLPGVMGINIGYTPDHQPQLDPFCFTWFGHEMGHTKNYLADTILFQEGECLLTNAAEQTGMVPRYGRSFSVRTLFQIPYVHLYEWVLLMDFVEGHFDGLPWLVPECAETVGLDLAAEINEAFEAIHEKARLTPLGEAALDHFRNLAEEAWGRWRSLGCALSAPRA